MRRLQFVGYFLLGVATLGLLPITFAETIRTVVWPTGDESQDEVLELQWEERFRFKRHLFGHFALFEHVT